MQALIHVRERNIAEKDRRIAEIEKHILNEVEDAKAAKRREQAENASPRCVVQNSITQVLVPSMTGAGVWLTCVVF